jgi:hypothetical protein
VLDLNPGQIELVIVLVRDARSVPDREVRWTLIPVAGDTWELEGPPGTHQVVASDVYALEEAKLLHCHRHDEIYGNQYEITDRAFEVYAEFAA